MYCFNLRKQFILCPATDIETQIAIKYKLILENNAASNNPKIVNTKELFKTNFDFSDICNMSTLDPVDTLINSPMPNSKNRVIKISVGILFLWEIILLSVSTKVENPIEPRRLNLIFLVNIFFRDLLSLLAINFPYIGEEKAFTIMRKNEIALANLWTIVK